MLEVRLIIRSIIEAKNNGYSLTTGKWLSKKTKECCVLSCVLIANGFEYLFEEKYNDELRINKICDLLGVDYTWVVGFINGFEKFNFGMDKNKNAYLIGKEIRKAFL